MRESTIYQAIDSVVGLRSDMNRFFISEVSIGELSSLSIQFKWGSGKVAKMKSLLEELEKVKISYMEIMEQYATIDAYSQNRHPEIPIPSGTPARKMGKNDLWIAATATVLDATLLTTDNDFEHLSPRFFQVENVGKWKL